MGVLPAKKQSLVSQYPRRDLPANMDKANAERFKVVQEVMTRLPGTSCCVQISYALNMSGISVPIASYRRPNESTTIKGRRYYFLAATDEMEEFLTVQFGEPEVISKELGGKARTEKQVKEYIKNRPGILVFRQQPRQKPGLPGIFEHTEIWDGKQIQQRDMNEGYLFTCDRVLLWDTNDVAQFLVDYMAGQG